MTIKNTPKNPPYTSFDYSSLEFCGFKTFEKVFFLIICSKLKTPKISKINRCNCAKNFQRKKITSMGKEP
jgi:hypothetical protein